MEVLGEFFGAALETVAGTPVTPPTHMLPFNITLDTGFEEDRPEENRGTFHEAYRSVLTQEWTDFQGESSVDTRLAPFILNIAAKGGVTTPTTPVGATLARLWEFVDATGRSPLKTSTLYWGDPDIAALRAPFGHINEFSINADGEGGKSTTWSIGGSAASWEVVAVPALPSMIIGPLIYPAHMEVFLDNLTTGGTIGGTTMAGRFTKVAHTLGNNLSAKFPPSGPLDDDPPATIGRLGRGRRYLETTVTFEVPDTNQLALYKQGHNVALRVRHNGPLIETGFRHFIEVDTYGYLRSPEWGVYANTNRTITFTVRSVVNTALGSGWRIAVQNDRATL